MTTKTHAISPTMDLTYLMECMGIDDVTREDAELMRDVLVERHDGETLDDVGEREWLDLLDTVVLR